MKKTLCVISLLIFLAQVQSYAQAHVSVTGQVGVPIDEFERATDAIGAGGRVSLLFPFGHKSPFFFGVDAGYLNFGSNTQFLNENIEIRVGNQLLDQIPINLRVRTNNNLVNGYAVLRVKAPLPIVQPYADILGGFNYLYTRTKVFEETEPRLLTDDQDNNVVNSRTQLNSVVLSYGAGAGVLIRVAENLAIDVRALYLRGQEADYFDESQTRNWEVTFRGDAQDYSRSELDSNNIDVNSPDGTPKTSRTDMISINFGIALTF